jgi:hypothetical protein
LTEANRAKLEKALQPFIAKAREKGVSSAGLDLSAVRTWANQHGHEVSQKGRVPQDIIEAYRKANGVTSA